MAVELGLRGRRAWPAWPEELGPRGLRSLARVA